MVGVWLVMRCYGVIVGNVVFVLYGVQWVDVDVVIELIFFIICLQYGFVICCEILCDDEIIRVVGLLVIILVWMVYDFGCYLFCGEVVVCFDVFMCVILFFCDDVFLLVKCYVGV